MPDLLVAALALGVGLFIGANLGASRAFRLMAATRRLRSVNASISRFMPDTAPKRTAGDLIAGRIRLAIGGTIYTLPVLPRGPSQRWLEQLDASFAALAMTLDDAGDDAGQILALLAAQQDKLYDVLLAYDTSDVLPSRAEMDEIATDAEILHAVLEVWRAVNPLAATVAGSIDPPMSGSSPVPSSSLPPSTGGVPTTSIEPSPTSSSSPTSTPPRSASTSEPKRGLRKRSKPSASAPSSPKIARHTSGGVHAPNLEGAG